MTHSLSLADSLTLPDSLDRSITGCEAAWREDAHLFRSLFEGCSDAILLADLVTRRYVDANHSAEKLTGYSRAELVAMEVAALMPVDLMVRAREQFATLAEGAPVLAQAEILTKTGRRVPVEVSSRVVRVGGRLIVQGILRDITEQRDAERALRESEERFRNLFEASPDAVFVEDLEGTVLDVNPAACRLHDLPREALVGRTVCDLVPHCQRDVVMQDFDKLVRRDVSALESYSWTASGRAVPVEIRADRLVYDGRSAILLIVRDVSARRALEREVLQISDEERQRIGQDIHDGLASQFSGIALLGRGLANRLRNGQPVDEAMVEEITELARTGAEQARALARGLSPVRLGREGLRTALQGLAHSAEVLGGLASTFSMDDLPTEIGGSVATQLYRIAQEAVHNAIKHAGATRLELRVRVRAGRLVLSVRDDGRGLPGTTADADGMGLHVMPYRARTIGATLRIHSAAGEGTCVSCTVPLAGLGLPPTPKPYHDDAEEDLCGR